jgi:hypothetical protein
MTMKGLAVFARWRRRISRWQSYVSALVPIGAWGFGRNSRTCMNSVAAERIDRRFGNGSAPLSAFIAAGLPDRPMGDVAALARDQLAPLAARGVIIQILVAGCRRDGVLDDFVAIDILPDDLATRRGRTGKDGEHD